MIKVGVGFYLNDELVAIVPNTSKTQFQDPVMTTSYRVSINGLEAVHGLDATKMQGKYSCEIFTEPDMQGIIREFQNSGEPGTIKIMYNNGLEPVILTNAMITEAIEWAEDPEGKGTLTFMGSLT